MRLNIPFAILARIDLRWRRFLRERGYCAGRDVWVIEAPEEYEMTALEFLLWFNRRDSRIPWFSKERKGERASLSELIRWLDSGGVRINGVFPKSKDIVRFPVDDFVMFPRSERRITIR